jgi:hypothetical protein
LFNGIAFLLLTKFSTFSVSPNALALLAVAALISVEGTFVEQLGDLVGVKVTLACFISHH